MEEDPFSIYFHPHGWKSFLFLKLFFLYLLLRLFFLYLFVRSFFYIFFFGGALFPSPEVFIPYLYESDAPVSPLERGQGVCQWFESLSILFFYTPLPLSRGETGTPIRGKQITGGGRGAGRFRGSGITSEDG